MYKFKKHLETYCFWTTSERLFSIFWKVDWVNLSNLRL